MTDSQIDPNSIQKNIRSSNLILLQSFYCLGWNSLLTEAVYLMFDTYSYIWYIYMCLIHVFQCPVKFVRSIGSIQYCIQRHVASLENCFSCRVLKEPVTNNNFFLSQFWIVSPTYSLIFVCMGLFRVTGKIKFFTALLQILYEMSQKLDSKSFAWNLLRRCKVVVIRYSCIWIVQTHTFPN